MCPVLGRIAEWTRLEGFNQRKPHIMNKTQTGQPAKAAVFVPATFEHEMFGAIRMIHHREEPWFVATDVCKALGYKSTSDAVATHVEPECKCSVSLGLPGKAPVVINEEGLYSLILGSHRPEAKAFKRWVLGTVLPSIRQHGGYSKGQEDLSPTLVATLHKTIKDNALPALRYYDKLTEHDHWKSPARYRASAEWAIQETALKFDLPVSLVEKLTMQGVSILEA